MRLGKFKNFFIISGSAILVGIVSFAVTISIFSKADEYYSEIARNEFEEQEFVEDDSSIRTNPLVNEDKVALLNENQDLIFQEFVKDDEEVKLDDEPVEVAVKEDIPEEDFAQVTTVSAEPVKEEITFVRPIDGEIILDFAIDRLVYSETLKEWITHTGIDLYGDVAMPVKVSAGGKVVAKKVDPRYGNTIIVEHDSDMKTIYSNLSTLDLVEVGQELEQGNIISGVGEGYGFEVEEGPHIHFELMIGGEYVNPIDYFVE